MIYMIILAHEIEIRIPDSIISFSSECRIPICNISFRRNAFASANPSQLASFIEKKDLQNFIFLFCLQVPKGVKLQIRAQDKFPCVFKIGHAHGGLGKVRKRNFCQYMKMMRQRNTFLVQRSGDIWWKVQVWQASLPCLTFIFWKYSKRCGWTAKRASRTWQA